jgi:PKD repeat protein
MALAGIAVLTSVAPLAPAALRQAQGGEPGRTADTPKDRQPWWDAAWKYCQTVKLTTPPLASNINTAIAEIDPMGKAQPDGRDVRVLTPQKAVLPHQVEKIDDGRLRIMFQVPPDGTDTFSIYYGNPAAPLAQGQWEKRLGGLTLETRAPLRERERWPGSWDEARGWFSAGTPVFGKGPRPWINDNRNPFGPTENFYGIYKGTIFCPEAGRYSFATSSDDASYLLIDGRLVCEWPGLHDASIAWEHSGDIELQRGIHTIEYYLVQAFGAALARAAWKKPSDKEYAIIPPEAFVQALPTRVTAYEAHRSNISAYFEAEVTRKIRFNKSDRAFTKVAFRDCSTSAMGNVTSWQWDFGDGTTLSEKAPEHEFTQAGEYRVGLEVKDSLGYTGQVARTVKVTGQEAKRVSIFFDTEQEENVLLPLEPLKVTLTFRSSYPYPLRLNLNSTVKLEDGRSAQEEANALTLERKASERDAWQSIKKEFAARPGPNTITFTLQYLGVPIADSTVRILPTALSKGALTVANNSLLDSQGHIVVFRLRQSEESPVPPSLRQKLFTGDACKIVIVEDSLSPAEGKGASRTFREFLRERLSERFPGRRFDFVRVGGLDQSAVYPPLERLARLESDVVASKPDIVIWSCSVSDILNYVPLDTFNRHLKASVEEILAQTQAAILLVNCPPVVVNPEMGHAYALATKKVGLLYQVPVLDLYSFFCRMGEEWPSFFQDDLNRGDPVFYVYPNTAGQELIAREIFEKLVE